MYDNLLIVAKNMAVIYKAQKSSIANKEGQKLYYPRVILSGRVDTDQIAKEIAELSSLTPGDTKNVIDNLVTVMTRHLQASESVTRALGFTSNRASTCDPSSLCVPFALERKTSSTRRVRSFASKSAVRAASHSACQCFTRFSSASISSQSAASLP